MTKNQNNKCVPFCLSISRKVRDIALRTYLAGRFDERSVFILTSSPRSGGTLLCQTLGAIPNSCTLFEPLHLKQVPQAKNAGFSWRTFVAPHEQWSEGERFLKRVFEGRIVNNWTTRDMSFLEAYNSKRMIVKFVRANRLLPWISRRFEVPAPVLLLRHPCAVISSQLNFGWKNVSRPDAPNYLAPYPKFQSALAGTEGDEEYLAASWALDQLPPLLHSTQSSWTIITYEELILRPEETISKIINRWNIEIDMDDALSRIKTPSSVVSRSGISGINGWKKQLTDDQISRVLSTVNAFGLDFYSMDDEPDYSNLYSEQLPHRISLAGTG